MKFYFFLNIKKKKPPAAQWLGWLAGLGRLWAAAAHCSSSPCAAGSEQSRRWLLACAGRCKHARRRCRCSAAPARPRWLPDPVWIRPPAAELAEPALWPRGATPATAPVTAGSCTRSRTGRPSRRPGVQHTAAGGILTKRKNTKGKIKFHPQNKLNK